MVTTDPSNEIRFEVEGQVATITFNRPEAMNAMTWNMYDRLVAYCDELDQRDDIRVAILKGAGDRAFVAGTDISQFQAFRDPQDAIDYERRTGEVTDRLERVRKPTIALIHGVCVGGGASIALSCDFRYADENLRFGIPIARTLGNCLSMEGYSRFVDLLGPSRLKELIFTARLLPAEEAKQAGFVHELVPADSIEARVGELARQIAEHAPITLRVTKEAIRRVQEQRRLTGGEDLIVATYTSADFQEGVRAFLEKRKPRWTGK
jgi:enoyl-CoA hydratase